ncbi:MAG TPA: hypothetical protein VGJ84_10610 [Polyangiaceae bacterium]
MHVRFYMDPETGQPHIQRHAVTEEEVEDVLSRPGEDRSGHDGSRVAIGQGRAKKQAPPIRSSRYRSPWCLPFAN